MNADYCIDANVLIAAWNVSHPIDVFPSLWSQLANHRIDMILIKPIFDQIDPKKDKADKSLRKWMIDSQFVPIPINKFVEGRSLELEKEYQIRKDSKSGVDENDLKLIAYAMLNEKTVVTEEGKQLEKPMKKCKSKIPLVCKEQGVECINFVEMLKCLGIKI